MMLLALLGGLFLCLALALREIQLNRERRSLDMALSQTHHALQETRSHLQQLSEDATVMRMVLVEHNLLDESHLQKARRKLLQSSTKTPLQDAQNARNWRIPKTRIPTISSKLH